MRYASSILIALLITAAGCKEDAPVVQSPADQPHRHPANNLARAKGPDANKTVGQIEPVAYFRGPMPTGVTVSQSGRIFVNYPRWGDPVEYSVVELRGEQSAPFPNAEMCKVSDTDPQHHLVSVQSVVVDPRDRLWILDTGSINFQPNKPGGPKLVGVDLKSNQVFKSIEFPRDVALPTSYLNDVRFDLTRGDDGMAFITDSSDSGPNGIVVVDLASGKSWRRLNDHPSTKVTANFAPTVEGEPLMSRPPTGPEAYVKIGSDGIAISNDGKMLYYRPLMSHHLYCVSVDALADQQRSDQDVAATVKDLGDIGYCSDGMEQDASGNIYLTDYEHNAVHRRSPDGKDEIIAQDPRMIWPDTMSVATDGYLYVTCNQLNRQPRFHQGQDLRQQPYVLFRTRIDSQPVRLAK